MKYFAFIAMIFLFSSAKAEIKMQQPEPSAKLTEMEKTIPPSARVESYGKAGRLDDFSKLEVKSKQQKNKLEFLFKENRPKSPIKLRVIEGPGTSGGGDILRCGVEKKHLLGPSTGITYYLADTYALLKSGRLGREHNLPEDLWFEAIFSKLNSISPSELGAVGLGDLVRDRLQHLSFVASNGPLPDLPDDQISTAGTDCEKRQLAIQDLETGVVRVDMGLLKNLTYMEQYYFKIHEALISLKKTVDDTTEIREELRNTVSGILAENILSDVARSYIEVPASARMLWVLKVIRAEEIYLWTHGRPDPSQSDEQVLLEMMNYVFDFPTFPGIIQQAGRQIWKVLSEADFQTPTGKRHIYYVIQENLSTVFKLAANLRNYVSPRIALVKVDRVNLENYEKIHQALIHYLRDRQAKYESLNWLAKKYYQGKGVFRNERLPELIEDLEMDMARFREEVRRSEVSQTSAQ